MDLEAWKKLFGKTQDDPAVKAALSAAGIKKVPKVDEDDTDVRFDLKGQGLWILMTDESFLKSLDDQDIGEGPLILSGVTAYLDKSVSRDLYKGTLPYKVTANMNRDAVRKILGRPTSGSDESLSDVWSKSGIEIVANYSKDLKLTTFGLMLPGAE